MKNLLNGLKKTYKNLKIMKLKAFTKALQYAFIPTAALLILLFFAFFDVSDTIDFISSNQGGAIALRIIAFVLEVVLVTILYFRNLKEIIVEEGIKNLKSKRKAIYPNSDMRDLLQGSRDDDYYVYDTDHPKMKIIERVTKVNI